MHRTISYPLAQAHVADLRQRAQRNTLARPVDRWGGTPLTDAEAGGHTEIAALLRLHAEPPHRTDKREAAAV